MDARTLNFLYLKKNTNANYENSVSSVFRGHFSFNLISGFIFYFLIIAIAQTFGQQTWVTFSPKGTIYNHTVGQQEKQFTSLNQNMRLLSSGSNSVSFTVHVDGMVVNEKNVGAASYQKLSIPDGEVITKEGLPQLPMIVKLVAVPDCDEVAISVTPSNELNLNNYNVVPAPGYVNKKLPNGNESQKESYTENKSVYSNDSFYPGKYGEIIETGYVRGQKVARIAVYPVQFNPSRKTLKVYSDFNVTLNFSNPKSQVNKEVGIFRNMMHHTALNYELSGISASSKNLNILQNNQSVNAAPNSISSGSITRVNDVNLLIGANALPVDYLIITHSSLFNSSSLTKLADHRKNYNGYDVVIVQVDNNIYDAYSGRPHYQSIRDFIADVYLKGKANHTGDGHLGYIILVGDALTDPPDQKEMVPAATPPYYSSYEQGGDYYYACTGGDNDDLQDLIYGRISAGNEDELENVVNKTITYESSTWANWQNNISFMSYSPWFFNDDDNCDNYFYLMAHIIPRSNYISYAWRGFAEDTASAWGRSYFSNHSTDQTSIANVPNDINEIWYRRFTGWRWYNYISSTNTYQVMEGGEYTDPSNICAADEFDNWLYTKLNGGQHIFVYEGHCGRGYLGAGEGAGRRIFRIDQLESKLHNYGMYPFIIANGCETGEFDSNAPDDMGSIDCLAEKIVNMKDAGAIGFLGSVRESTSSAFNHVDKRVLEAFYNNSSHIMGEAVMESKLLLDKTFRRQYNLYGDPAINLFSNNTIASTNNNEVSTIKEFELENNYPNPFNPSTTISYKLKSAGYVTLKVFDALGREIKTLVNEYKDKGSYSILFNGSGLTSDGYASGVYYYQLKVNSPASGSSSGENYVSTKKMLLLK